MMKLHLLTTLLISLATSITGETCPDTSVQCAKQEITCATGPADFSDHPKDFFGEEFMFHRTKELEGYHCVCPEGLTGLRCARPYEKCDAGHFCYHGGECIPGMSSTDPNDLFCDCQKAEHNGDPYAGKFCEVQLQKCGSDSEIFCARSGQCKPDFEDKLRPCVCPQGIRGPHCEFYDDHVPNCKLECQNDGLCTRGIKSYDTALYNGFWAQNDGNFQHCECKEGFYGLTCEAEAVACGESQCFHGGTCVQTLNSKNKAIFACDCNTAKAEGASWAGQYCQSKATNYCSKDVDQNGQLFCANNGDCKDEAYLGCDCEDGFHGPSCEHSAEIPKEEVEECSLQCRNGGKCRNGAKDNSFFSKFGADLEKYNMTHINWEHCVCADGYFGIMCEHQLETCPGGDHVCLHGSKCSATNETNPDGASQECDCGDAFNSLEKFAGRFCQYESTDICTNDGKPGVAKAKFAFCVNNGKCKDRVDDSKQGHPGCDCPAGFNGDHCEFLLTSGPKTTKSTVVVQKGIDNGTFNILIALAGILVVLIGIVSVLLFKRKQKITDKEDKDESVAKAEVFKGGDPSVEVVGLSNPTDAESEEGCPDDEAGMKSVEIL